MRRSPEISFSNFTLTHVVNHGTHHRAEMGMLLERIGRSPGGHGLPVLLSWAVTDSQQFHGSVPPIWLREQGQSARQDADANIRFTGTATRGYVRLARRYIAWPGHLTSWYECARL